MIKLPQTGNLYRVVSNMVAHKKPEQANASLNVGVFQQENSGNIKQLNYLLASQPETMKPIKYDTETGNMDSAKGLRDIPKSADYWLGNSIE